MSNTNFVYKVENMRPPIVLKDLQLSGFAMSNTLPGQMVKVAVRMAMTSDDPIFHKVVEGLGGVLAAACANAGARIELGRANTALLVIHPGDAAGQNTAELWIDSVAVAINALAKRPVEAGKPVYDGDIADIVRVSFPAVAIGKADQVVYLFREGWRFGLLCDFNPDRNLSVDYMERAIADLYRVLRYRHLYEAVADPDAFERLIAAGWFPFVEILPSDIRPLLNSIGAGFDPANEEAKLLQKFDAERVDRMLARWIANPNFEPKDAILRSAVDAFKRRDPVGVIKILLTEIEGVLRASYERAHGRPAANTGEWLSFASEAAERRAGSADTLFFPHEFGRYLREHTFRHFDKASSGTADSRHAVSHGAASAETYTLVRALQAMLTIDQLAFYTHG